MACGEPIRIYIIAAIDMILLLNFDFLIFLRIKVGGRMKYVLEKAFTSIMKKVFTVTIDTHLCKLFTYHLLFFLMFHFFLLGNQVVGDKISLGVFSNETDWSQEKIEKVSNEY